MSSRQLRKFCVLDTPSQKMLQTAMEDLGLSARAHDRILRMARTIADLEDGGRDQGAAFERGDWVSEFGSAVVGAVEAKRSEKRDVIF